MATYAFRRAGRRDFDLLAGSTPASRTSSDLVFVNAVAVRAAEKAGFRRVGDIETPDGPAVPMAPDRA